MYLLSRVKFLQLNHTVPHRISAAAAETGGGAMASWYAPRQNSSFQLTKRASHLTTLNSKQPLDFQKDKTNNIKQEARLLTWWHSLPEEHLRRPKVPPPNACQPSRGQTLASPGPKTPIFGTNHLGGGIHPNPNSYHALTTNACQSHFLFPLSRNIDPVRHTLSIHGWPQQISWTAGWSSSRVSVVCTHHV